MKKSLKVFFVLALIVPMVVLSGFVYDDDIMSRVTFYPKNVEPPSYEIRRKGEPADLLPLKVTPLQVSVSMHECIVFYDMRIHNPRKTAITITSKDFTFDVEGQITNNRWGVFFSPIARPYTNHVGIFDVCPKIYESRKSSIKIKAGKTVEFTIKQWVDRGNDETVKIYFGNTLLHGAWV